MKVLELHLYGEVLFINLDSINEVQANYDGRDIPHITDFSFNETYEIKIEKASGYISTLTFTDYDTFNSCLKAIKMAIKSSTELAFYDYYFEKLDEQGRPANDRYNVIIKDGKLYEV